MDGTHSETSTMKGHDDHLLNDWVGRVEGACDPGAASMGDGELPPGTRAVPFPKRHNPCVVGSHLQVSLERSVFDSDWVKTQDRL
jgi:hypothetical protein